MISWIIIIIGLVMAGVTIFKNVEDGTIEGSKIVKALVFLIGGVIVGILQPFAIEKIDAGNVGLRVNLTGDDRGVSKNTYVSGWNMYNTWTSDLHQYPTTQQTVEYPEQQVITKGGFGATIHPTFNYSVIPSAVSGMFQNLRLDLKSIEQGWLKTAIVGAVNDVANTWEVDSIFGHRQSFEMAIVAECNLRLSKWFIVSQMRSNIIPPEALQEAIVAKTRSVQQAEASKQQAIAAKADGERKVAVAKADSAEMIISASAAAKSIKLKQQELTPVYIEYVKAQAWDGKLPTTMAGSSGTFLNIK